MPLAISQLLEILIALHLFAIVQMLASGLLHLPDKKNCTHGMQLYFFLNDMDQVHLFIF